MRRAYRCSSGTLYKALYEQLELRRRKRQNPWPRVVGIDEHFFRRAKGGYPAFVSVIVDYDRKRLLEVVEGKTTAGLEVALASVPERENVRYVVCDLADPFKNFARGFFPGAAVIADKFHVLRLLTPALNRRRKAVTGDRRTLPVRKMPRRSGVKLNHLERYALAQWLEMNRPGFPRGSINWETGSHGTSEQVFTRGQRARGAHGARQRARARFALGSVRVDRRQDRLYA